MQLQLTAKTQKGKNILKEYGKFWDVINYVPECPYPEFSKKPAYFLMSEDSDIPNDKSCLIWVLINNDKNFNFEKVQ